MPIRVVATGRVAEGPSQQLDEHSWMMFVLDPLPGLPGARLAHACEVMCRTRERATSTTVHSGDRVEVTINGSNASNPFIVEDSILFNTNSNGAPLSMKSATFSAYFRGAPTV